MTRLRRLVLDRLMRYYRFVSGLTTKTVTSAQVAESLDIDPTQVRKDFAAIGLQGMGRVGFEVCEACRAIRVALGFDQQYEAVLVGAGHLGGALLAYPGFGVYGLHIVAAFDSDKNKIGTRIAGYAVRPMRTMNSFIRRHKIRLAVLTTPGEVAQQVTDRLVSAGVNAIWNFTPGQLTVPPGVLVRSAHISLGLSEVAYHLKSIRSYHASQQVRGPSTPRRLQPGSRQRQEALDSQAFLGKPEKSLRTARVGLQ